ncbi:hypothetical protein AVEN_175059-1 [Araneus ventricosus]|uniref:Uncharacterized protein n=1 Tax=Araneus ventricosus TaxID=182803 RepID=A0A4Y2MKP8_ARAVE|nr:hypothetical protein AVEN_175059-1 [Araneus ventricosus]
MVMMFVNSFGGLLVCLWIAGGLPVEEKRMKDAFRKKIQQRRLSRLSVDAICLEEEMSEKSDFVLSGCDIIHFRRSSIATLAGTILTYTILLISKD